MIHLDLQSLLPYQKLYLGLSGGLDSVVLFHLLRQHPKLQVIHVHHGLSPHADAWQAFCQNLCQEAHVPFIAEKVVLATRQNIEEQARVLRYQAYKKHVDADSAILLAHHLDDQIETFLLNALRGCGIDGLKAMPVYHADHGMHLYRPLLSYSRQDLLAYAEQHQLTWVEDESNQSRALTRNYLRHEVLPLIEARWPSYRKTLAKTIRHCQAIKHPSIEAYLDEDAYLRIDQLPINDLNLTISLLRAYIKMKTATMPAEKIYHEIYKQLLHPKRVDAEARIYYDKYLLEAYDGRLYIAERFTSSSHRMSLSEGRHILVIPNLARIEIISRSEHYSIGFRQGGERFFYKGHHRVLKKLLQEWRVPPHIRERIPLLYEGDELKSVLTYANADEFNLETKVTSCQTIQVFL